MKILDWYILKRYLLTFFTMLLLFIPIGITVHLAEKIGKILDNEVPLNEVLLYFLDFTIYFAHLLFPLFLFLSVIWFTSKLANNMEVTAFLSSGVSFYRFLRPYMIGALIVASLSVVLGLYLAPKASQGFNDFNYKYFKKGRSAAKHKNVYKQISDHEIIYVNNFNLKTKKGRHFSLEYLEGNQLKYKITADVIQFSEKDSLFYLNNYMKRTVGKVHDKIERSKRKDTIFNFDINDLTPVVYAAETKMYGDLKSFIDKEEARGSSHINHFKLVLYKKWSLPISIFILTIIAISVSSIKRRGGMGLNLALGISIAMIFVFFDKIFGVMAKQSDFPPIIAVWFPNMVFTILAGILFYRAKR